MIDALCQQSGDGEPAAADFRQVLERLWWRFDRALGAEDVALSAQLGAIAAVRAESGVRASRIGSQIS